MNQLPWRGSSYWNSSPVSRRKRGSCLLPTRNSPTSTAADSPIVGLWTDITPTGLAEAAFGMFTLIPWANWEGISYVHFPGRQDFPCSLIVSSVYKNVLKMGHIWYCKPSIISKSKWPKPHSHFPLFQKLIVGYTGDTAGRPHTYPLTNPPPILQAETEAWKMCMTCQIWDSNNTDWILGFYVLILFCIFLRGG